MRFRKGTKVEVLTQKEVPSGSWRCAEIVGGNGHNYAVRYYGDMGGFEEASVERVPRKAIRPCPPSVDVSEDWVPGDVVEVFHNFSWKMATVLKVLGWNHLLVRLLGSAIELKASKHDVRARLCWQDSEWIVIGKASSKCEDLRLRLPSSRKDNAVLQKVDTIIRRQIRGDYVSTRDNERILESQGIPPCTLKRKQSHPHSEIEADPRRNQKIRVGEKERIWHPINAMQQPQLPEKVDVACSQELLGEKFIRPFANTINGCHEMISQRVKTNGAVGCSPSICLEPNGDDSVASSVGSCSVHRDNLHYLHYGYAAGPLEDNDSQCSDAESVCQLRPQEGNCLLPAKEGLTEEIHRLELHAYRCIIEALHASGPLSWDQELLLTNLRDSLHISNDEHLMEIRNLVSSSACIPC